METVGHQRYLKIGEGWRIGWNPDGGEFKGLVGADSWAFEMTGAEFLDFCRLALQLEAAIGAIAEELMDEENLSCDVESDLLRLQANGYPHAYELHLILMQGRRGEGFWTADVTSAFMQAIHALPIV
jgi:hypothetical protein